ncbi:nmrA-like family protein [Hirsutella rhossiliensis]
MQTTPLDLSSAFVVLQNLYGILLQPAKFNRAFIQGLSQSRTSEEVVKDFEQVTGKKARYIPMQDCKSFNTRGKRFLTTVQQMFDYCQQCGGLYFGAQPSIREAVELKRLAAAAQGRPREDARLQSMKEFFQDHFGGKEF